MTRLTEALGHVFDMVNVSHLNERHEPSTAITNLTGQELLQRAAIARNRAKQYLDAAESMEKLVSDHLGLKDDPGDGGFCACCRKDDGHYAGCALDVIREARRESGEGAATMWAVPPITGEMLDALKGAADQRISALSQSRLASNELILLRLALDRLEHSSRVN